MSKEAREVMVIPASAWERGQGFHRVRLESLFDRVRPSWMAKPAAEVDPAFRQVIPVAIVRDNAGHVLAYRRSRAGGEARLHDAWSILVGGHVERGMDEFHPQPDGAIYTPIPTMLRCLWREAREEFGIFPRTLFQSDFRGFVAFDGDEVGRVHLGVVYGLDFHDRPATTPGDEIAAFEWIDPRNAGDGRSWEPWSALALQAIGTTTIEIRRGKSYLTMTPESLMAESLQDGQGAIPGASDDKIPAATPKTRQKRNTAALEVREP